jgi:transcription antitermination factor NusG
MTSTKMTLVMLTILAGCLPSQSAEIQIRSLLFSSISTANTQSPPIIGEVTVVDAANQKITVKTKAGDVSLVLDDKTAYLRVPPGETTLKNGEAISLGELRVADRVMAFTSRAANERDLRAQQVIVMSKAAIDEKQKRDLEQWRTRGVAGVVIEINPATKEIKVASSSADRSGTISIAASDPNLRFRRYAPDSVRFSDAKSGSFDELKVGDQLRALIKDSAGSPALVAEEIVSGSFQTVGGTILDVMPETSEIRIKNVLTGQVLTVVVSKDSRLSRMSPEALATLKQAMASKQNPSGTGNISANANRNPGAETNNGTVATKDPQDPFEHLPAIAFPDLKQGATILISSTVGSDPSRVTAIMLVTGVEGLFTTSPAAGSSGATTRVVNTTLGIPGNVLSGIISP